MTGAAQPGIAAAGGVLRPGIARRNAPLMTGQQHGAATAYAQASGRAFVPQRQAADCDDPGYCFPALDEAGQYERPDARPGLTAWDIARALEPGAIFLPDGRAEAIVRGTSRATAAGAFPPDWDLGMITGAVLATARDPDLLTWDDPVAWPGTELTGQPCWRAEGTAGALAITVALSADGEILSARSTGQPGATRGLQAHNAAAAPPGTGTRRRGRTQT